MVGREVMMATGDMFGEPSVGDVTLERMLKAVGEREAEARALAADAERDGLPEAEREARRWQQETLVWQAVAERLRLTASQFGAVQVYENTWPRHGYRGIRDEEGAAPVHAGQRDRVELPALEIWVEAEPQDDERGERE